MATTTVAAGKVRVAYMKGVPVPPQSLVDENGVETTDPSVIFGKNAGGAMQPFGAHKGYGLMVICELLGGALGGLFTMQPEHPRLGATLNNMLSILIDPAAIGDLKAFDQEVGAMIDYIHASTPAEGIDRVRLPGDPEKEAPHEECSTNRARSKQLELGSRLSGIRWARTVSGRGHGHNPPALTR